MPKQKSIADPIDYSIWIKQREKKKLGFHCSNKEIFRDICRLQSTYSIWLFDIIHISRLKLVPEMSFRLNFDREYTMRNSALKINKPRSKSQQPRTNLDRCSV